MRWDKLLENNIVHTAHAETQIIQCVAKKSSPYGNMSLLIPQEMLFLSKFGSWHKT